MRNQHSNSSVLGLSEHLANLELPITIQAPKKVVRNQNLSSTPDTFGEVATFLSTPFVDDAISTDEYQNLDDAEKHIRDMAVGYWLPGRYRDKKSRKRPSEFLQSYFVFDLIDCEPAEFVSMQTLGILDGYGAVLMHSLRGHTADKPKVRLIFPMFEPISLLEAYFVQPEVPGLYCHLNLEGRVVGESLMDVDRPLALPSISEGEEFWFQAADGAPFFADSIIDELEDN
jgi:hypothetical protein